MDRQSTVPGRLACAVLSPNLTGTTEKMLKIALGAVAVLVVVLIGGAAFLMVWDIPAPQARVERVIPDARFPK